MTAERSAPGPQRSDEVCHHVYVWPAVSSLLPAGKLSILDAGCGRGRLTRLLAGLGHDVIGVDVSGDEVAFARELNPGVRFEALSICDDLIPVRPPGGFDVVIAAEVIEHLYSPTEFLENMAKTLKPGGAIILSTPYHGYLKNLLIAFTNKWDAHFSVAWEGGHIKFFSKRSLSAMLEKAGFVRPVFRNVGRLPFVWKSIVCRTTLGPPSLKGRGTREHGKGARVYLSDSERIR